MEKGRVLVTGAAGYIGSVLCRQLLDQGYFVRALDRLLFGGESLLEIINHPEFDFVKGDVRNEDLVNECLIGMDAVVHLAALVGDKACKTQAEEATEVMDYASKYLYAASSKAGLKHFVFASTCSNYGLMEGASNPLLNEDAALQPQSHYARLKVGFEQHLLATPGTPSSILRFATVYGLSPRIRFDLSVNHFTRDLSLGRELLIFGADTWRPYCHVKDLARSVVQLLQAGPAAMDGKVYNVGNSQQNYTKRGLVAEIMNDIPDAQVKYAKSGGNDLRDYRIDFTRIQRELSYEISLRVPDGIAEVHKLIQSGVLLDPDDLKYVNA